VAPVAPFNDGLSYESKNDNNYLAYLTKYTYVSDRTKKRADIYFPFLRFADVLLIYAEAANEANNGPTAEALNALNRVRVRSNATPKSLTGVGNINDKVLFRSAVLEERAMEFAEEGDRRWDLIRWGIYLPVMNAIGGTDEVDIVKTRMEKHLLFPIPGSEVGVNKFITKNNPGW
jgi:putative outer membrane protein